MKKALFLLFLSSICCAWEPDYIVDDQKTRINFDSLSIRAVDNSSNQTVAGNKTFSGTNTHSGTETFTSSTTVYNLSVGAIAFSNNASVFNAVMPAGFEMQFISATPPAGYNVLLENGQSVSTITYTALFLAIQAAHPGNGYYFGGSGANFNIPDNRGYFLRMADLGSGQNPDQTAIGGIQQDAMQGHKHYASDTANRNGWPGPTGASNNIAGGSGSQQDFSTLKTGNPIDDGSDGTPRIAVETRSKNRAVAWFIKY